MPRGTDSTIASTVTSSAYIWGQQNGKFLRWPASLFTPVVPDVVYPTFLDLTDVDPVTYVGQGGKIVAVNSGATGLEFISSVSASFKYTLSPYSAELVGATTEPLVVSVAGTNTNWSELQYPDGASNLSAHFYIPSKATSSYTGGNINIDIDFYLTGTLTNTQTVIFGVGIKEVNAGDAIDTAPPTSGTGYSSTTYTIGTESASLRRTITVTIAADASISAGQMWVVRLTRVVTSDTSVSSAKVIGLTLYE